MTSTTMMLAARRLSAAAAAAAAAGVTGRTLAKPQIAAASRSSRQFATRRKPFDKPLAQEVLDALPSYFIEGQKIPGTTTDPWAFPQNPVTSAHMIDLEAQEPSALDSAALTPEGKVVHGRYGDLGETAKAIRSNSWRCCDPLRKELLLFERLIRRKRERCWCTEPLRRAEWRPFNLPTRQDTL